MIGDAFQEVVEVVSGEGPVEWFCDVVVAVFEGVEALWGCPGLTDGLIMPLARRGVEGAFHIRPA